MCVLEIRGSVLWVVLYVWAAGSGATAAAVRSPAVVVLVVAVDRNEKAGMRSVEADDTKKRDIVVAMRWSAGQ